MSNRVAIIVRGVYNSVQEELNAASYGQHINMVTQRDTSRIIEFLQKPLFGNWQAHEIINLPLESICTREQILQSIPLKTSFVFFYYNGHGNADINSNVMMQFGLTDDDLFVRELENALKEKEVSNYLVVANCCRASSTESEQTNFDFMEFPLENFSGYESGKGLNLFENVRDQKVIVYTALENKKAFFGNTGNLFTESFFRSIFKWLGSSNRNEVLFIKDLIDLTNVEMSKHGGQQAEIENYQKGNSKIPVCIFPINNEQKKDYNSPSSANE